MKSWRNRRTLQRAPHAAAGYAAGGRGCVVCLPGWRIVKPGACLIATVLLSAAGLVTRHHMRSSGGSCRHYVFYLFLRTDAGGGTALYDVEAGFREQEKFSAFTSRQHISTGFHAGAFLGALSGALSSGLLAVDGLNLASSRSCSDSAPAA
jgi:hypothetical protein